MDRNMNDVLNNYELISKEEFLLDLSLGEKKIRFTSEGAKISSRVTHYIHFLNSCVEDSENYAGLFDETRFCSWVFKMIHEIHRLITIEEDIETDETNLCRAEEREKEIGKQAVMDAKRELATSYDKFEEVLLHLENYKKEYVLLKEHPMG